MEIKMLEKDGVRYVSIPDLLNYLKGTINHLPTINILKWLSNTIWDGSRWV